MGRPKPFSECDVFKRSEDTCCKGARKVFRLTKKEERETEKSKPRRAQKNFETDQKPTTHRKPERAAYRITVRIESKVIECKGHESNADLRFSQRGGDEGWRWVAT